MKKLVFFACALALMATTACKDDDGNVAEQKEIVFDGKAYRVNAAMLEDYGAAGPEDEDPTHYNYTFSITDAANFNGSVDEVNYVLITDLYSSGTQRFTGGTFEATDMEEDISERSVVLAVLFIDLNKDGDFTDANEMQFAESGTVQASGSGTNYQLVYNLTFLDNKKLTGKYAGNFEFFDETEGERTPGMDLRKASKMKFSF